MNQKLTIVFGILLCAVLAGWIVLSSQMDKLSTPAARTKVQIAMLEHTLESYRAKFGDYPVGNSTQVFRRLAGDNPEKLIFLRVPTSSVSTNGEYLDQWGTPYEIKISATNRVTLRSAGANKLFGDADDLTNER